MSNNKLFKATFVLMVVTIISKGIGLFRDVLVGYNFGTTGVTDAYATAVSVPDTIFAIIGLAISTTFIPALSKAFHKEGNKGMYTLANNIMSILTVISIVVFAFGFIYTEELVSLFASGYTGEKYELTVFLTRISLFNILLLPINACFSAILQYKEDFIIPGILGLFFNLPIIVYLFIGNPTTVIGLTIANVIGNVFRVVVQIPSLYKHGFKIRPFINLKDERIKCIMLLLIPVIIGAGANSINMIVDRTIASGLVEGSVSSLDYAQKLIVFANSIITMSILTVVYPLMSKKLHEGDLNSFFDHLCKSIRLTAILLLPMMSGLILYRVDIVTAFYGRGQFDSEAIALTSLALIGYAVQLPFLGVRDMLNSSFFSMEKTKITSINSIIGVVINIALSITLSKKFGVAGIAMSTGIAAMVTSFLLFMSLKRMTNGFDVKPTVTSLLKMCIATAIMTIALLVVNPFLSGFTPLIKTIIGATIGAIIYFIVAKILKVTEVEEVVAIIFRKKNSI
ncbi:MAG: murein biosynthesis integral membrane protein MurJ [Clostridium sp.]